jgi:hypothetical protein
MCASYKLMCACRPESVSVMHLLKKHIRSRRPASWRYALRACVWRTLSTNTHTGVRQLPFQSRRRDNNLRCCEARSLLKGNEVASKRCESGSLSLPLRRAIVARLVMVVLLGPSLEVCLSVREACLTTQHWCRKDAKALRGLRIQHECRGAQRNHKHRFWSTHLAAPFLASFTALGLSRVDKV